MKTSTGTDDDFLVKLSRQSLLIGLFFVSFLVIRVGSAITLGDAFLLISAALLLGSLGRKSRKHPFPTTAALGVVLLVVGGAISTGASLLPLDSLQVLSRLVYLSAILPWQAIHLLDTPARFKSAVVSLAAGTAISSGGVLLQVFWGQDAIPGGLVTTAGRFSGFTGHVSDIGAIAAISLVLGTALLSEHSKGVRGVAVAALVGGAIGLIMSGSVSGMLSAICGVGIIAAGKGLSLKRAVAGALLLGGAFFVGDLTQNSAGLALNPIERLLQTTGSGGTSAELNTTASRVDSMALGLQSFISRPFVGVGLDPNSALVVDQRAVHNLWIAAAYQGGVFFLLGIVIIVGATIRTSLRSARTTSLTLAVLSACSTTVIFSMTAPSTYNRYFWVPVALLVASSALGGSSMKHGAAHLHHSRKSPTVIDRVSPPPQRFRDRT